MLPRLRNLELIACRELTLEYRLGERRKSRPEAKTFVDERDAARGRARRIGVVYVELAHEDAEPEWFSLGPQLAQLLGVPNQRDAFSLLLAFDDTTRRNFLSSRGVADHALEVWATALSAALEPVDAELSAAEAAAGGEGPKQRQSDEAATTTSDTGPTSTATNTATGETSTVEPPPLAVNDLAMEEGPAIPVSAPTSRPARPSTGSGARIDWDRTAQTSRRVGSSP